METSIIPVWKRGIFVVSICVASAVAILPVETAFATGWFSPSGTDSPGGQWANNNNAIDTNTATYAGHSSPGANQWGQPLWLTNSTTFKCGRIRVYSDFDPTYVDMIRLEIRTQPDGTWTNVYEGTVDNCSWSEISFPAAHIDAARYSYHYIAGAITFWLYEFQLYEDPPQVNPPACTSVDPTSVEEASGTMHGNVTNDGGEPCQYRFQYGLTSSYSTNTDWTGSLTSGDDFGILITGLTTNTTYHYRAQVKNSAGISSGSDNYFTTGVPPPGWVSPTGYGSSGAWTNIFDAFDDNTNSFATCYHNINAAAWSPYIYITHSTITCERIRFNARHTAEIDLCTVEVDLNGTWTSVYSNNTYMDKQWVEASFPRGTVTQARVRFDLTATTFGMDWQLNEFDFYKVSGVTLSGTYQPSNKVSLAVDGRYIASFTNYSTNVFTFTPSLGVGSRILIYYDDNTGTKKGALVTLATGQNMTGLNIQTNMLVLRNDHGSAIANSDLVAAYTNDIDVPYVYSGTNIVITNNTTVYIPAGHTYSPGNYSITIGSNLVIDGNIADQSGTLVLGGSTVISGTGTASLNNVTISGALTAHTNLMHVAGDWINNGTFNHNSSAIDFNGSSSISGTAASSFKNITISGSLTAPSGTMNVAGNFINNGTFSDNNGTVVFNGSSVISGASDTLFSNLVISTSSVLKAPARPLYINGNWSNSGTFSNNSGTVVLQGPSTATITGSNIFNNFTCITPGKQINFAAVTNQTVTGTFNLAGNAANMVKLRSTNPTNRWIVSLPGGAQSVTYVDVSDSNASNNTVTVTGGIGANYNANWIFTANRYWVGGAGTWSDTNHWSLISGGAAGASAPNASNFVIINNASGTGQCTVNVASATAKGVLLDTGNNITLAQGTNSITIGSSGFEMKAGSFLSGNALLDLTGDFNLSGGAFTAPSGQLIIRGAALNHTGGVFSNNAGTVLFAGNTVITDTITNKFNNLAISGNLTAPATSVNVSGSWSNSGVFTHNNGTVNFCGNTAIQGTSSNNFFNVSLSGILTAGTTTMAIGGDFADNGSFAHNNSTVIFNGTSSVSGSSTSSFNNVIISGTLNSHDSLPVQVAGNWINNGTFNHNGGVVTFNGNTAISGSSPTLFNSISIQNTLTAPAGVMYIAGNLLNNGTFNNNGATVTFNGSSSIGGSSATFLNNVEIWGSLAAPAASLYVAGYWANYGTFMHNNGTVVLNGSTDISGANVSTFNMLSITGTARLINPEMIGDTAAVQLSGSFNLNNQGETIASLSGYGSVTLGSATLTIAGTSDSTFSGNITQSGALLKTGSGTLSLAGTNTYTGGTTINAGQLIGNAQSIQGAVANNAAILFNQPADGTYSGVMTGSGTLAKTGAATLTMTGNSSYAGSTTISNGTLRINGNNSAANGAVTVMTGAFLTGTGSVGGPVTLNSGAFTSPDTTNSVGALLLSSTLALNGQYVANITNYNSSDLITAGTVTGNGSINVILGSGFTPYGQTNWTIIAGGAASSYANITNNLTIGGTTNYHYSLLQNGNNLLLQYKGDLPVVDNDGGAASIGTTTATLNGNLTKTGVANPAVRIFWGLSDGGTNTASWATNANVGTLGIGAFSTVITNLTPTTVYWYRSYASNSDGIAWAPASTNFSTKPAAPSLSTLYPSPLTTNSAALRGQINPPNDEAPGALLYWGLTDGGTNPVSWGHSISMGTVSLGIFSTNITGLTPATRYFCNSFASNSAGARWGVSTSFWTIITATVTNDDPTTVTTNSAQLNGILLDTGAQNPEVHIFWGPTDGNIDPASWSNNVNLGTMGVTNFSITASNLLQNTVYYYRCYATNTAGPAWASESYQFTTASSFTPSNGANIFDDNFYGKVGQNPPTGWTKTRTPTVTVISNNAISLDESEFASYTRNGNNQGLSCTFPSTAAGVVVVEWLARVNVVNQVTTFHVRSGGTDRGVIWFNNTGTIQYFDNTTTITTQPYNPNTWYRMRLELNVTSNRYNIFINNVQCGTNRTMRNTGAIDTFFIDQGANNSQTLYLDDFEVYTHKKWVGAVSTNWNVAANWAPNGIPAPSDTVRITDGDQLDGQNRLPTLNVSAAITNLLFDECNDGSNQSTITDSVLTVVSTNILDVSGSITLESNATINVTDTGTINCYSNFYNYGVFNCGSGTVVFDGNSRIEGTSPFAFNNLVITGALTLASANEIAVSGNWVNTGTFAHNGRSVTFNGNTTISGTRTTVFNNITVTGILTGHSNRMDVTGNWDASAGTFSNNNGKVVLSGSALQTINTGGAWNPATTNNNWKNNWGELIASNAFPGGIVFADGFKAGKFTCTLPNSTLNFRCQDNLTNVFEVASAAGLRLQGAVGQLIKLRRFGGSGTNRWEIAPTGSGWTVSYVDVSDSANSYTNYINPTASVGSAGAANNINWFNPTFVQLCALSAWQSNTCVYIDWRTASEINNAGFFVYRSDTPGGPYTRLNSRMIQGLGNSLNGRVYSYADNTGPTNSTAWYKLESVEFSGATDLYGPVSPSVASLSTTSAAGIGGSGSLISPKPVPAGTGSGIYKIYVDEPGIYRLTSNFLTNAVTNLSSWITANIRIYNQGQEIATGIHDEGTSLFETNDYVEFYGTNVDTRFSGRNVYWLYYSTNQMTSTPRFQEIATPSGGIITTSMQSRTHFEENSWYEMQLSSSPPDADHWFFDDYLVTWGESTNTITLNPVLTGVFATNSTATIRIAFRPMLSDYADYGSYNVTIKVNGTSLTNVASWSGLDQHIFESQFGQAVLVEGTNTVQMTMTGDPDSFMQLVYVNWIDVDYHKALTSEGNCAKFLPADASNRQYTISYFASNNPAVYRISGIRDIAVITNTVITGTGTYSVTFSDTAASGTVYNVSSPDQIKTPAGIENDISSDLRNTTNRADYIIITHSLFNDAIEPLAAFHRSQGMNVMVVDVEDIYDDFNYGVFSPYAIRTFIAYAKANWAAPAPQYVLLVGSGTYDYRNYTMQPGIHELVPVILVNDADDIEAPSDNWYVSPENTIYPQMCIGRFPARSTNDVTVMVNKTINYHAVSPDDTWARTVAFIAGDEIHNDKYYERMCTKVAANLPSGYIATNIFRSEQASELDMHNNIIATLNSGTLLTMYAGHGNRELWSPISSGQHFFNLGDAAVLTNSPRYPIVITPTCMNGSFADTVDMPICLAAQLLCNSNGAVACISPSGMALPQDQRELVNALADVIFKAGSFTIGKSFCYALHMLRNGQGNSSRAAVQTTVFFGDPAINLLKWSSYTNSYAYAGDNTGDSDGDGIPDGWEIANGLDPMNPDDARTVAKANGRTYLQEYIAGTNPRNPSHNFQITSGAREDNSNKFSWESIPGRWYTVQVSQSLADPNGWTDIPGFFKISGDGTPINCSHTPPNDSAVFYRVIVSDQP